MNPQYLELALSAIGGAVAMFAFTAMASNRWGGLVNDVEGLIGGLRKLEARISSQEKENTGWLVLTTRVETLIAEMRGLEERLNARVKSLEKRFDEGMARQERRIDEMFTQIKEG